MTRCDHGGKSCPHTYSQAFYVHRSNPDGEGLVELIAGVVTFLLLVLAVTVGMPVIFEAMAR